MAIRMYQQTLFGKLRAVFVHAMMLLLYQSTYWDQAYNRRTCFAIVLCQFMLSTFYYSLPLYLSPCCCIYLSISLPMYLSPCCCIYLSWYCCVITSKNYGSSSCLDRYSSIVWLHAWSDLIWSCQSSHDESSHIMWCNAPSYTRGDSECSDRSHRANPAVGVLQRGQHALYPFDPDCARQGHVCMP